MSNEETKTILWYTRVNSKDQLIEPEKAEVYTPSVAEEPKFVYSKLAKNPTPQPRRDRSKWHLKNLAKVRGLGIYKVVSTEQRLDVKRKCEQFDRDNSVTMEDVVTAIRKFIHGECCYQNSNNAQ